MNKKLSTRFNMFLAVLLLCKDYPGIVSLIVAFLNAKNKLAATVAAIEAALEEKLLLTNGVAESKTSQKEKMCKLAHSVASALFAWASSIGNDEIIAQTKLSYSDIFKYRDDQVATICTNIYKLAVDHMDDLTNFGLTKTINDMLLTAATNYKTALPSPRVAKARKKAAGETIVTLLNEGNELLKTQMDPTSILLQPTQPEFVKQYKANRKLVNLATVSTQIKGTFVNQKTKAPIQNGVLELVEIGKEIVTNDKGEFASGKIPNGKYIAKAKAINFITKDLLQVEVKRGQITRLNIVLEPAA